VTEIWRLTQTFTGNDFSFSVMTGRPLNVIEILTILHSQILTLQSRIWMLAVGFQHQANTEAILHQKTICTAQDLLKSSSLQQQKCSETEQERGRKRFKAKNKGERCFD
jgi:hypothetical protein